MDYNPPAELQDLGLSDNQQDDGPQSVLDHFKGMSPPVVSVKVSSGDTLGGLAKMYGTTVREIVRVNPDIKDANKIRVGQHIDIPMQVNPKDLLTSKGLDLSGLVGQNDPSSQDDSIEPSGAAESLIGMPGMGALKGLAAAGLGKMMPKLLGGLAEHMPPPLPAPGMLGNAVKGAVNYPGAMPSMSNVAPLANQGQSNLLTKMALLKQRMSQPLSQGGQMPMGATPPMTPPQMGMAPSAPNLGQQLAAMGRAAPTGQTLRDGARMPWLGAGTGAPPNPLQMAAQRMSGNNPQNQMLSDMIAATRKPPTTLGDLRTMGQQTYNAHPNAPFQDLLRKMGYNQQ